MSDSLQSENVNSSPIQSKIVPKIIYERKEKKGKKQKRNTMKARKNETYLMNGGAVILSPSSYAISQ